MDARGGTITWFLTANDADFDRTTERVRRNARRTADDVDRDFKRGFGGAKLSLDDFRKSLGRSAQLFRDFQIALRGFELTSMIIGATLATGAIIELIGALTALGGLALTIPAGIATLGGAFGALIVGTSGVADAFKEATKQTKGMGAAQNLAKRQSDIMRNAMRQDEALTRRLNDLKQDYADTLKELADERLRKLNEQILRGVEAWKKITDAAGDFLDIAARMDDISADITQAQADLNTALITYGANSVQVRDATQKLYASQARLAQANAQLDTQYSTIKDSVKDLATNLNSLKKANRNEMQASLLNLKAMRLEKQSRGENIDEITNMINMLEGLINIKDTKLTTNIDTAGAQASLDALKAEFPSLAVAAKEGATEAEKSLTKSLGKIKDSMADVARERAQLHDDLKRNLADVATQSAAAAGADPFAGLSTNARKFVQALIEVKNAFEPVRLAVQDKLFAGLDQEIIQLAKVYFPILKQGLGDIATEMNSMAKEASRVAQLPFFTGAVQGSLANTAQATSILTGALEPLARVTSDLVNLGNPYVLMLSEWLVKQAELAAGFTGSEEGQLKMADAINLGITALKGIGSLLGAVGGLFLDLFKISNESGISLIGTLTEMINNVRDWLATSEGQSKMAALFEATDTILRAVLEVLGKFIEGVLTVVEAYNNLDGPAKDFITNLLVFSAIATPVLTYLSSIAASLKLVGLMGREVWQLGAAGFGGFRKGLDIAKQAVFDFQSGFGNTKAAASVFTGFMGTLGGKAKELVTKFQMVGTSIKDMALTSANVTKQMAINAANMAKQGLVAAGGWIKGAAQAAGAWIAQSAVMIARGAAVVVAMVAQGVTAAATWIAGAVATAAAWVVANAAILGVWGLIIAAVVGAVALIVANWDSIVDFFKGVWDAIVGFIAGAVNWVKANWPLLLGILIGPIGIAVAIIAKNWDTIKRAFAVAWDFIKGIWSGVVGFFKGVWDGIVNIFRSVGSWFSGVFQAAWNGIKNIWSTVGGFFKGIWTKITEAFNGAKNLGKNIIEGLWNGINDMGRWISEKIKGFGEGVLNSIKDFFGIHSPSRLMRDEVGKMLGLGIADGITQSTSAAVRAAQIASDQISAGFSTGDMAADFSVTSTMAPSVIDTQTQHSGFGSGVVINQKNEVYTDLDMDQINRNLTWELNKI